MKNSNNKLNLLFNPILITHIESLGKAYKDALDKFDYDICDKIKIEIQKIISPSNFYLEIITAKN